MASNQSRRSMRLYTHPETKAGWLVNALSQAELHVIDGGYVREPEDVVVNEAQIPLWTRRFGAAQLADGTQLRAYILCDTPQPWVPTASGLLPEPTEDYPKCTECLAILAAEQPNIKGWPTPSRVVATYWHTRRIWTVEYNGEDVEVAVSHFMPWADYPVGVEGF